MLTASDLTCMRDSVEQTLPGTVTISRATGSSDGMGGQTQAWAAVGTVSARVAPMGSGDEDILGAVLRGRTGWMVTLPEGTDVTERDRVVYAGQTFEVLRTSSPMSYETCVRVQCVEVS